MVTGQTFFQPLWPANMSERLFTQKTEAPAVMVRDVRKVYAPGVDALDGVSLTIEKGRLAAIMGPNGSGKTTLLRVVGATLPLSSGTVNVLGVDVCAAPRDARAESSFVPQEIALDPEMSGIESLRFFAALSGIAGRLGQDRIDSLARSFGLSEQLARRVASYSGGMKRRLHVVLGLLDDARLLLLDEAFAGLDAESRLMLWSTLRARASSGGTVVVVTHDAVEAERHCDVVVVLGRGRLLAAGSPVELVNAYARRTLRITTAEPVAEEGQPIASRLTALPDVTGVTCRQTQLSIEISSQSRTVDNVLSTLSAAGVRVMALRIEEPDLANAYLRLSGDLPKVRGLSEPTSRRSKQSEGRA
jgi:ABC-2 type transport system ATP-binding protein